MILIIISFIIGFYLRKKNSYDIKKNKLRKRFDLELNDFISYSQYFEDLILFCVFYDIKNGFYIDVGANDPNIFSVTKTFYLRGWNGINIEPLPNEYQALVKYRTRDLNLKIGASDKEGNSTLFVIGMGSTLLKNYSNKKTPTINVSVYTMKNICKKYVPKNINIEFCKIDVEGEEKKFY